MNQMIKSRNLETNADAISPLPPGVVGILPSENRLPVTMGDFINLSLLSHTWDKKRFNIWSDDYQKSLKQNRYSFVNIFDKHGFCGHYTIVLLCSASTYTYITYCYVFP